MRSALFSRSISTLVLLPREPTWILSRILHANILFPIYTKQPTSATSKAKIQLQPIKNHGFDEEILAEKTHEDNRRPTLRVQVSFSSKYTI